MTTRRFLGNPLGLLFALLIAVPVFGQGKLMSVYQNFDSLPVTAEKEIPGSGAGWLYTSHITNPDNNYGMTVYKRAGWRNTAGYKGNDNIHDYFNIYSSSAYNNPHMGFEVYGYLEIDGKRAVKGNSLRFAVTGGKNSTTCPSSSNCNGNGLPLTTKEEYLDYLAQGKNPVEAGMKVGAPYLYFMNTSLRSATVPFEGAKGANRLSLYVHIPDDVSVGNGGTGIPPAAALDLGPYNNIGGHWYNRVVISGGGWVHIMMDGHPQHNNAYSSADRYPYPSYSLRCMDTAYFNTMHSMYFAFERYEGISTPPYSVWFDEIEFKYDSLPQNDETIANAAVLYKSGTKSFEIGFNDKYKNNQYSYSSYEVRYSFSPITNDNWEKATPVMIQAHSGFGIKQNTQGRFEKWWPYYQNVWAPFKLASSADEARLTPGATIHFAVKDISQVNGDGPQAVDSDYRGAGKGGRDYQNQGATFDYAGDKPVLKLIKRIDYTVPGELPSTGNSVSSQPDYNDASPLDVQVLGSGRDLHFMVSHTSRPAGTLEIWSSAGKRVSVLEPLEAAKNVRRYWIGRNLFAPGVYTVRLKNGKDFAVKRFVWLPN